MNRDVLLINAAGFSRSFGVGFIGVLLGIYLSRLGFSSFVIGSIIATSLAGTAFATVTVSLTGDRVGRRKSLFVLYPEFTEGNAFSKVAPSKLLGKLLSDGTERKGSMPLAGQGAETSKSKAQQQTLKGLSVASAAHELRNPVDAMVSLVYLLQQTPNLDGQTRNNVQQLDAELRRVQHIINDILGGFRKPANSSLVSLPDLLDTILRSYSQKIAFKRIGIDRRYECEGVVQAHSEDLRQVFSNLIVNALESLRLNGRLTVHIYPSRCWSSADCVGVRVVIGDNGSGILPEHRNKIMSGHFFTTKGEKGTGLGLWLSAELVRKQGGSIRFRSSAKLGRSGTVFSVFLPTPVASGVIAKT